MAHGVEEESDRHSAAGTSAPDPAALDPAAQPGPRSIAIVTTAFPTLAAFVEDDVHRLRARGVRVGIFALRRTPRDHQARHVPLLAVTEVVGDPLDPRAWGALVAWLVRRPGALLGGTARILWASRRSPYALAGHVAWLPAACLVASRIERDGYERVHGAWAHFPGTVAWLAARLTRRPFSLSAHAGADLYRTRAFLAEKVRAARFTSACVEGNAELLRSLAGPAARVEWIPHGVDLARFDGAGRAPEAEPVLIAVGRLSVVKGFDDAIRALAVVRGRGTPARLWIVGDGPDRAALETLARGQGVAEAVRFLGALGHEGLLPLYRRAWLLVAPSRVLGNGRRDGIPNVIVEAMAMGLPCVGTRVGGIEEAIVPGRTGALAEPGDVEGLAAAIESVLRDPATRDALGRAAAARARERFDAARSFERTWALFAGAPGPPADLPDRVPAASPGVAR